MNKLIYILISVSLLFGCKKINSDSADIPKKKYRYLASLKETACTDNKDRDGNRVDNELGTWIRKLDQLEKQTICTTGYFEECSYALWGHLKDSSLKKSTIKYLTLSGLSVSGHYLSKAVSKPSIWSLLPEKPPIVNRPRGRNNVNYAGPRPFKEMTTKEIMDSVGAYRDKFQGKKTNTNGASRFYHVATAISSGDDIIAGAGEVKAVEGKILNMVMDLGENKSIGQMTDADLDELKKAISSDPVRRAETLTQLRAAIADDLAKTKTRAYAIIAEIGDEAAQLDLINEVVGDAKAIKRNNRTLKLTDIASEVVDRTGGEANEALKNSHLQKLIHKIRVLEHVDDSVGKQLGLTVRKPSFFANKAASRRFFTYYYYREMLTSIRQLSGFNKSLRNPDDIFKAISIIGNFGKSDIRINSPLKVGKNLFDHNNTTESYLNKVANKEAFDNKNLPIDQQPKKWRNATYNSFEIAQSIRSPKFVKQINLNIVEFGELMKMNNKNFFVKTMFSDIAESFISYSQNGTPPKSLQGVAGKLAGTFLDRVKERLGADEFRALGDRAASNPALRQLKTKFTTKLATLVSPAIIVGLALNVLDIDFYYMIGCSVNNLSYGKHKDFFHDDCSVLEGDLDDTEDHNIFAKKFHAFRSIKKNDPLLSLEKQLELLATSRPVCEYMDKAYKYLVEDHIVQCIKKGDPNAEKEDDRYTHGYIGNKRYNLYVNLDEDPKSLTNGYYVPSGLEIKAEQTGAYGRKVFKYLMYQNKMPQIQPNSLKMAELGLESFSFYQLGERNMYSEVELSQKNTETNNELLTNPYVLYNAKSSIRSLTQHYYCCNKEFETDESECLHVQCDPNKLPDTCKNKPEISWGQEEILAKREKMKAEGTYRKPTRDFKKVEEPRRQNTSKRSRRNQNQ